MPRAKKTSTASTNKNKLWPRLKLGESYVSLLLGIIVVIVAFILVFTVVRNRDYNVTTTVDTSGESAIKELPKNYEVKAGDYLWTISEKLYGSGYNWVDLADANKIQNPDVIYTGTKLTVPNVKPKKIEVISKQGESEPIKSNTYTVKQGDYLWDIAIRAYGDGYKWTEIAKANKLTNPDLIFSGNSLKIPR
ncbi:MAG: hypothetical protein A2152_02205 [Candidatus Levybacteria bacterium RBG_16_35_6]|nr:MAG: hypothetical protein A2152_02205 [Candidatus Levybacteria bacterium RBG_16_35_6]